MRGELFNLPHRTVRAVMRGVLLVTLVLFCGLAGAQDSGFLVQIAGRGPSATGAIDNAHARGLFAIVPIVIVRVRAGPAIALGAQGFSLVDATGNRYGVSLDAMKNLNASFTGESINLDSSASQQQMFLIFDVPTTGIYRLTGPGIQPGGIQYDVR